MNEALAFPLPFEVISDMLAMPTERSEEFRDWSQAITLSLEPTATPADLVAAGVAIGHLIGFLVPVIEDRRHHLGDDLLSGLLIAEESGERLSLPELISTVVLLYVAGHETTVNLIGNGALALAQNPDQRALWRAAGPSLDTNAIDELLRFDGPVQQTIRVPLVDMEVSGGIVPAGRRVLTLLGSANRDADVFPDPDKLILDRPGAARHMAFASGIHYCLGAAVAASKVPSPWEPWSAASNPGTSSANPPAATASPSAASTTSPSPSANRTAAGAGYLTRQLGELMRSSIVCFECSSPATKPGASRPSIGRSRGSTSGGTYNSADRRTGDP